MLFAIVTLGCWINFDVSFRFVYGLHPFETIFMKTVWGEGSTKVADNGLGQVMQIS